MSSSSPSFLTFPPAPNWYCAHALTSCGPLVAYAARQDVVVVRHSERNPDKPLSGFPVIYLFRAFHDRAKTVAIDLVAANGKDTFSTDASSPSTAGDSNNCSSYLLATTSEDGLVRCWNLEWAGGQDGADFKEPASFKEHSVHTEQARDRQKVNSCSWSSTEEAVLYSGDENGKIVIWDTKFNSTRSVSFGKQQVNVLRASPHRRGLVAVGYKQGLVLLVDLSTEKGKVLHKIRAHDEDIQGLSWCPSTHNVFSKDENAEAEQSLLFAVASRDKTFSVWSAKSATKVAAILPARNGGSGGQGRNYQRQEQSWNCCLWSSPSVLHTNGTAYAELVEWDLTLLPMTNGGFYSGDDRSRAARVLHREHPRILTSIARSSGGDLVTIGQDRALVSYSSRRDELNFNLPAFAAWIFCLAPNPIDSRILAVGGGDGVVRIWNLGNPNVLVDSRNIWQKLSNAKVTALAWHPSREGHLALGTDEGRIILMDVLNTRSQPRVLSFKHRGQVYNLSWGPSLFGGGGNVPVLYSVADSKVMMHPERDQERSMDVEELTAAANRMDRASPGRSELAFHPSGSFMALGSEDGSVEVFRLSDLRLVATLKSFSKLIQCLTWHPPASQYDGQSEVNMEWCLAVASNETDVHVFDLSGACNLDKTDKETSAVDSSSVADGNPAEKTSPAVVASPDYVLSGHHLRVISLAWSPHEAGRLVSVSYDTTAQVWDVPEKRAVGNFSGHQGRLLCCLWHPVDPDAVLTGSEDGTLRGWRVSQLKDKMPSKKAAKKANPKKRFAAQKQQAESPQDRQQTATSVASPAQSTTPEKSKLVNGAGGDDGREPKGESSNEKPAKVAREFRKQPVPKEKFLFHRSYTLESKKRGEVAEECLQLLEGAKEESEKKTVTEEEDTTESEEREREGEEEDDRLHLRIYGSQDDAARLLEIEASHLVSVGQVDLSCHLLNMHGDVAPQIASVIESGQRVTEAMVNVAASVSRELWVKCCSTVASQFEADGDFARAASYHLMTNNLGEAIEVLKRGSHFRTAFALAKSRLDPSSPIVKELCLAWARHAQADGNLEVAARGYVAAGRPLEASTMLSRRKDALSLFAAAMLAKGADEEGRAAALAEQTRQALLGGDDLSSCIRARLDKEFPKKKGPEE